MHCTRCVDLRRGCRRYLRASTRLTRRTTAFAGDSVRTATQHALACCRRQFRHVRLVTFQAACRPRRIACLFAATQESTHDLIHAPLRTVACNRRPACTARTRADRIPGRRQARRHHAGRGDCQRHGPLQGPGQARCEFFDHHRQPRTDSASGAAKHGGSVEDRAGRVGRAQRWRHRCEHLRARHALRRRRAVRDHAAGRLAPVPAADLVVPGNSTLFRVDDTVERMEVLRGGSSPIFSNGQPGLTVNFIQKKARTNPKAACA